MYVCKDCEHESKRVAREHKKSIIEELKTVGCACCGEKDTVCLDFHHYDPSEKEFNLSTALTKPVNKLIEEASKCVVVCSNCHRKIHAGTLKIIYPGTNMSTGRSSFELHFPSHSTKLMERNDVQHIRGRLNSSSSKERKI